MPRVIVVSIQRNKGCTWSTIAEAFGGLGDKNLKERILHFGSEINRIEKAGHDNYCKSLPLLDGYCHEDSELGKRFFQTDKLACTSVLEYGEELFQCLKEKCTCWYEMGLLMGLDNEKLHNIAINTTNSEKALRRMINGLIMKHMFSLTWRKIINVLIDMDLNVIAEKVAKLDLCKTDFPEAEVVMPRMKLANSDFILTALPRVSEWNMTESPLFQKDMKSIRDIFGPAVEDISDQALIKDFYKHVVKRNPSISERKKLVETLETVGKTSVTGSKELIVKAEGLKEDLDTAKSIRDELSEEKGSLIASKQQLQHTSQKISQQISTSADAQFRSTLEQDNEKVLKKLEDVCVRLEKCIWDLDKANADYESIRDQLYILKGDLMVCKGLLLDIDENLCTLQMSTAGTQSSIADALDMIREADKNINSIRKNLYSSEHPYINELQQVFRSFVTGRGAERAEVGIKATAVLHTRNFMNRPCEAQHIEGKFVSTLTGKNTSCEVGNTNDQSEYDISYTPRVKGWHQFHIKLEGGYVGGKISGPFCVAVTKPVETLGTPILTIDVSGFPESVAVSKTGEIVVKSYIESEDNNSQIDLHAPNGTYLRTITRGKRYPGIAFDGDGKFIFTAAFNAHTILKLAVDDCTLLDSVGSEGTGPLQFHCPNGIAFNASNDKLYVADWTSRIQVLNSNLTLYNTFDTCIGSSCNKIITCDKTGLVYVCEDFGNFIEILTAEGRHKSTITTESECVRIRGIAVDDDGYIYMVNLRNNAIGVYTSSGQLVKTFGGTGSGPGQFDWPYGLAVDTCGVLYVCDRNNHRVQIF